MHQRQQKPLHTMGVTSMGQKRTTACNDRVSTRTVSYIIACNEACLQGVELGQLDCICCPRAVVCCMSSHSRHGCQSLICDTVSLCQLCLHLLSQHPALHKPIWNARCTDLIQRTVLYGMRMQSREPVHVLHVQDSQFGKNACRMALYAPSRSV